MTTHESDRERGRPADLMWLVVDADGNVKSAAPRLCDFVGSSSKSLTGQPVSTLLRSQDAAGRYSWRGLSTLADASSMNGLVEDASGSLHPCILAIEAPADTGGQRIAIRLETITRTTGPPILKSPFSRALIDALPGLFFVMDEDMNIVRWNKKHHEVLGYSDMDMLTSMTGESIVPDARRIDATIRRLTQSSDDAQFEDFILAKDGRRIPTSFHIVRRRIAGREYIIGTAYDLSEKQETQRQIGELRARLDVVSRIATFSQLATALAHDLNQPIAAIANNAHALLTGIAKTAQSDAALVEPLEDIAKLADRCGDILRHTLAWLRADQSQIIDIELGALVQRVAELGRIDLAAKGCVLKLEQSGEKLHVRGDAIQLQQVILNLVNNAADALATVRRKSPLVTVKLQKSGQQARIKVTDNGPGIDPAVVPRLFEAFVTTKPEGLGLGLAICKSIIEAHDGGLEVLRSGRKGAVFHISLPLTG